MASAPAGTLQVVQVLPSIATPGATLRDTVTVRVVSSSGAPLPGRMVTWVIGAGEGSVESLGGTTDDAGVARARWTLGKRPGLNALMAHTLDGATSAFSVRGEAFRSERIDSDYGWACGTRGAELWCWGQNSWGDDPGVSESYRAPVLLHRGSRLSDVAVGWLSYCVLEEAGSVWCGGTCFTGPGCEFPTQPVAVAISGLPAISQITSDDFRTYCGIAVADSAGWCWTADAINQVPGSDAFIEIRMAESSGKWTGCGLLADSTAACWIAPSGPVAVPGGHRFVQLAVGRVFACGLDPIGEVWCWGENYAGQLGRPGPDSDVPVLAADRVSRISATSEYAMAIRYGSVIRWGYWNTPVVSLAGLPVAEISRNDVSCVLLDDGQAYCFEELWLNRSTIDIDEYLPVPIPRDPAP